MKNGTDGHQKVDNVNFGTCLEQGFLHKSKNIPEYYTNAQTPINKLNFSAWTKIDDNIL